MDGVVGGKNKFTEDSVKEIIDQINAFPKQKSHYRSDTDRENLSLKIL